MAHGSSRLSVDPSLMAPGDAKLAVMPRKVEQILRDARTDEGQPMLARGERVLQNPDRTWAIDMTPRTGSITVTNGEGKTRVIPAAEFPPTLRLDNIEGVAFAFIGGHPGAIEIAGVILLMSMLGAVVLARKKVELDERALREHPHGPLVGGHTRLAVQGDGAEPANAGGGRA